MASYRYERNITEEDVRSVKERTYTRKERWNNWWDYNLKWVVIAVIVVGFVGYSFIGQYFFTVHPDYNIGVVAPYYLPEDTVNALETQLAAFGVNSMMSSNVQSSTLHMLTSVSVFTFSPWFSLLTVYVLILAATAKSFFFISLSIRSFHNLL